MACSPQLLGKRLHDNGPLRATRSAVRGVLREFIRFSNAALEEVAWESHFNEELLSRSHRLDQRARRSYERVGRGALWWYQSGARHSGRKSHQPLGGARDRNKVTDPQFPLEPAHGDAETSVASSLRALVIDNERPESLLVGVEPSRERREFRQLRQVRANKLCGALHGPVHP